MVKEEEVSLSEGMPIENEEGIALGKLSALLVEEDAEEAEFFLLESQGVERLLPFEAILGVGDGMLIVDVPAANVQRFPPMRPEIEPTEAEMELAYEVFDEGASSSEEDEDVDSEG
ncbi:MAG: PRC-barrel domain-containing protein [Candidatus Thermoplasmatota archaeon]